VSSFLQRIADQREELILRHARLHLDDGEQVTHWVRARRPQGRGEGFVFLTPKRVIFHWTGRDEERCTATWDEVVSWGFVADAPGGPILGIETKEDSWFATAVVATKGMAVTFRSFLQELHRLAPSPKKPISPGSHTGSFEARSDLEVGIEKKSIGAYTKRVIITVIGVTLVTAGFIMSLPLVPGPGILVIIAGLAVLASEYDWAKDAREWARYKYKEMTARFRKRPARDASDE
jgi:uncharacterized protein (TIGR02611 family)